MNARCCKRLGLFVAPLPRTRQQRGRSEYSVALTVAKPLADREKMTRSRTGAVWLWRQKRGDCIGEPFG